MSTLSHVPGPKDRKNLIPRWAWIAGAVAVLAFAIFAAAALSAPKRPAEKPADIVTQLSPEQQATDLASQAAEALAAGDTTKAAGLIDDALALDPDNTRANEVGDEIPDLADDDDDPASGDPGDDDDFLAVLAVRSLLPTVVPGYSLGTAVADKGNAEIPGEPNEGTKPAESIARVQLAVHDRGTAEGAAKYVADVTKKLYAKDAASATVSGVKAYVATDGERLAAVVFTRGRYVFEVVSTSRSLPPAGIRAFTVEVAKSFPADPS